MKPRARRSGVPGPKRLAPGVRCATIRAVTRSLASALALILTVASAAAESRTWTSSDGRTITGELLELGEESITVRRADGRVVDIDPAMLAEADREHLAELRTANEREAAEKKRAELLEGPLTYALSSGSEDWPDERRERIVAAMDAAVAYINEHGDFEKHVTANNSPGTPTADANYEGWINFGGSINRRVALHEISHTLGIGTHPEWQKHIEDGRWTGEHALRQLREFDGPEAILHADRMHFWPYGLNFDNESSEQDDLKFVSMVEAFRKDLGIR